MLSVVILTLSTEERDLYAAYLNRVNNCVSKPVDFEQFVDAGAQLQSYWLVLNCPPLKYLKAIDASLDVRHY